MAELLSLDFGGGQLNGLTYTDDDTNTPTFDGANGVVMPVGSSLVSGDVFTAPSKNFAVDFTYLPIDNSGDARANYHMMFRLSNAADTVSIAVGVSNNFNRFFIYRDYTVAGSPGYIQSVNDSWVANTSMVLRLELTDLQGLVLRQDGEIIHQVANDTGEFEEPLTRLQINPQITSAGLVNKGHMAAVTAIAISTVPQPEEVDIINHDFTGGTLGPASLIGAASPTFDANGIVLSAAEHLEIANLFSLLVDYGAEIVFRLPVSSSENSEAHPILEFFNSLDQRIETYMQTNERLYGTFKVATYSSYGISSAITWQADERLIVNLRRTALKGLVINLNDTQRLSIATAQLKEAHSTPLDKLQINKSLGVYQAIASNDITVESIRVYEFIIPPEGGDAGGGGSSGPRKRIGLHQRMLKQMLPGRR